MSTFCFRNIAYSHCIGPDRDWYGEWEWHNRSQLFLIPVSDRCDPFWIIYWNLFFLVPFMVPFPVRSHAVWIYHCNCSSRNWYNTRKKPKNKALLKFYYGLIRHLLACKIQLQFEFIISFSIRIDSTSLTESTKSHQWPPPLLIIFTIRWHQLEGRATLLKLRYRQSSYLLYTSFIFRLYCASKNPNLIKILAILTISDFFPFFDDGSVTCTEWFAKSK